MLSMCSSLTLQAPSQLSIVKAEGSDADTIGDLICRKAQELQAALVVMAAHTKGSSVQHAVGGVTRYCTRHCTSTVLVMQQV